MKIIKLISILTIASALFMSSCKKESENNSSITFRYITAVDSVNAGNINEPIIIEVKYLDECYSEFNRFIQTKNGNSTNIKVEVKFKSGLCRLPNTTKTAYYTFTPRNKGNYTLNFKSSASEFITTTIIVD